MKIFPKKSLGQNFLSNTRILEKIVSTAEVTKSDLVIEVGPGRGEMTQLLSEQAGQVIAIEKDHRLIEVLEYKFKNSNVQIVESDVLKFDPYSIIHGPYKLVANLPYYITSHFLRAILEKWPAPELIVLVIQKEVAQRIMAKPPHMNLLALSVQLYAQPKIMGYISKGSFNPVPKVDSAIIRLLPNKNSNAEKILSLAKVGFSSKRKMLVNNLSTILPKEAIIKALADLNLNLKIRAENISITQWEKLSKLL